MNEDNEKKDFESKITSIHTLESDLASAVRDDNYGKNIIKIVTDPNRKSDLSSNTVYSDKTNNAFSEIITKKNIIIFLIIVIILGTGIVMLYILNKAKNLPLDSANLTSTSTETSTGTSTQDLLIIGSDILNTEIIQSSDFSGLNRFEIITEINKIKQLLIDKKIEPNNNIGIRTNMTVVQLFEKIRYSGSESLLRSFGDIYAFGLYSIKNSRFETYLLIEIKEFDLAFKSILDWEKYIGIDLKDIFIGNNEIVLSTSTSTISTTSTSTVNTDPLYYKKNTQGFVDNLLKNYDTREFINNENNIHIIYGFINNKYLLITSGESSFVDIKDRLLKENIVR